MMRRSNKYYFVGSSKALRTLVIQSLEARNQARYGKSVRIGVGGMEHEEIREM